MKEVLVYGGDGPTNHPELGLLDPVRPRELAPREKPAVEAAAKAGLEVSIVSVPEDADPVVALRRKPAPGRAAVRGKEE